MINFAPWIVQAGRAGRRVQRLPDGHRRRRRLRVRGLGARGVLELHQELHRDERRRDRDGALGRQGI